MRKDRKISAALLRRLGACERGVAEFEAASGGKSVEVTRDWCIAHPNLNYSWAARHLLSRPARDAYYEATKPAHAAYSAAIRPPWDAYYEATKAARRAHDEAAKAVQDAYDEAAKAAWRAYYEAAKAAELALALYQSAAFADAYINDCEQEASEK